MYPEQDQAQREAPIPLISHAGLNMTPGNFGAEVARSGLRLPVRLEAFARGMKLRDSHTFLNALHANPEHFAQGLSWSQEQLLAARARLIEQMQGRAPEGLLRPVAQGASPLGAPLPDQPL